MRLLVAACLATTIYGCHGTSDFPNPLSNTRPTIEAYLEHGFMTSNRGDVLHLRGSAADELRVTLGDSCTGGKSFYKGEFEGSLDIDLSANGELAADGSYPIQACSTRGDHESRATVNVVVDNTAPVIMISSPSVSSCRPRDVTFFCPDCATIAYSFDGSVAFDAEGNVTSGTAWSGFPIYFDSTTTMTYAGIDVAGNVSASQSFTFTRKAPPDAELEVTLTDSVISDAWDSNETSAQLSATSAFRGGNYRIGHIDDGGCNSPWWQGTLGDTNGDVSVTIYGYYLNTGVNTMRVCVEAADGCGTGTATIDITRKDSSLGWTLTYPSNTDLVLRDNAYARFDFNDAAVNNAGATPLVYWYDDSSTYSEMAFTADMSFDATGVTVSPPSDVWLPEEYDYYVYLDAGGLRDEAGNPLPDIDVSFYARHEQVAYPFGQGSFSTNANGLVEDATTGLFWTPCPEGRSGADCATGTMTEMTLTQAIDTCYAHRDSATGGRTDWRVPTYAELLTIVDVSATGGYVQLNAALKPTGIASMWSASGRTATNRWPFVPDSFYPAGALYYGTYAVRCVAGTGNPSPRAFTRGSISTNAFVASSSGAVILDEATELVWEYAPSATTYDHATAQAYCSGATIDGVTGWRLPTNAHVLSLLEYGVTAGNNIPHELFSQVNGYSFWLDSDTSYQVFSMDGSTSTVTSTGPYRVWCVRPL